MTKSLMACTLCVSAAATLCVMSGMARKTDVTTPVAARPQDARVLGVGRLVGELAGKDLAGKTRTIAVAPGSKATVIAMTSASCPITKKYAPSLARIERQFKDKGVSFFFVAAGEADTVAQLKTHVAGAGFVGPCLADRTSLIAAELDARTTAEVFVLDAARSLVYRGAIDDQYGLGVALDSPRNTYLIDALDAVVSGSKPAVAATTAPGCRLEHNRVPGAPTSTTYHNRISRIVQDNCVSCHREGGLAPFSLESYHAVTSRAAMIESVVQSGQMPPWFAAPAPEGQESPWKNDRALSAADKADLMAWLGSSRPEGDAKDAPLPLKIEGEWTIGEPDAVLELPTPQRVKAEGTMPYQHISIPTNFSEDRWVTAYEIQPTARDVVHHVVVFFQPPEDQKNSEGEARRPGRSRVVFDESRGFFGVYVPGNGTVKYPEGFARLLPKGTTLIFQMHYTPVGKVTTDQTRMGLKFAKEPPRHVVRAAGVTSRGLRIPAGAPDHPISARAPVPRDVMILALMPHMHLRGKAFMFETIQGDRREVLLDVPRYDFDWQLRYELREPLRLPKGSFIRATGRFDNSENNPANPDPSATVRFGPQTTDEMMSGLIEYYLADEAGAGIHENPLANDGPEDGGS